MNDPSQSPLGRVSPLDYLLLMPEIEKDPNLNNWWQHLVDTNPSFANFLVRQADIISGGNPEITRKIIYSLIIACTMIERANE